MITLLAISHESRQIKSCKSRKIAVEIILASVNRLNISLCSWLLRDPEIEIRTFSSPYLKAVDDYFATLFPLLVPLQVIVPSFVNVSSGFGDYWDCATRKLA